MLQSQWLIVAVIAVALASCKTEGMVQCISDESCNAQPGGVCMRFAATSRQWCTYPDSSCPSGSRWSDHDVGDNIAGVCVGSGTAINPDAGVDAPIGDGNVSCMPRVAFHDGPYTFQTGGKREIYVSNPDGTGLVNVSNSPDYDDVFPTWSPDGVRVAFQSNRNGNWDIYVAKADGSALVNMTNGSTAQEERPVWSPDGTKIAYFRNFVPWYMTSAGTAPTRVVDLSATNFLTWSPDSSKLAFGVMSPNIPDIFVASLSGGAPVNVTSSSGVAETQASWAPGPTLIFGAGDIFSISPDGSGLSNLTNSVDQDFFGLWSPLGDVFYSTGKSGGLPTLWRMSATGQNKTQITSHELIGDGAGDFANDVSSNGQLVAFERAESFTAAKVGVVDRSGGTPKFFSAGGSNARKPVFAKCP